MDAQPFAALLDGAVSPSAATGAGAQGASVRPDAQKPDATGGSAAQDHAGSAPTASSAADAANRPAPRYKGAPTQDCNAGANGAAAANTADGKPVAANNSTNLFPAAVAPGTSIEPGHTDGTQAAPEKHDAGRKPGDALSKADPAITIPVPSPAAAGSGANASSVPNATHEDTTSANHTSAPDATDAANNAPNDTPAAGIAALVDLTGSGAGNGATPIAAKPGADSKDNQKDHKTEAADSANGFLAASGPQLPDAAQPVAAAMVVNAAAEPESAGAGKPPAGMIADAAKARAKVMPTAMLTQTTPAQDTTDALDSSSPADAGGSNGPWASSESDDLTTDAAATQQVTYQPQALAANGAALFGQIDFASLGGTEHFGSHADVAASSNGTAIATTANGANATAAPNFGLFAPGLMVANGAPPPAAAPDPPVPLADLAVTIAGRAQAGSSRFDIRLDPPELGRIDVRLDVDGSGQVRTHVTVDRSDTLQLLQSQQPQLERALEQAGLKTADNGLQFTLRDQSFAGQNGGNGGHSYANQSAAPLVLPDIEAAPIDTAQIYARLRLGRGLDISV
jgi:flagellar hook-length control protein FliK